MVARNFHTQDDNQSRLTARNHKNDKLLSNIGSTIVNGYQNIGGDNFVQNTDPHNSEAKIRIRGKYNEFDFKTGDINVSLNEQQQAMIKRKVTFEFDVFNIEH